MGIYVEIRIRGSMDDLWSKTQTPQLHQEWDLRFTDIQYLPSTDDSAPQKFQYSTRIGFGVKILGEGETVGSRDASDGSRTSALKFWSDDPKSLIRKGAGFWKYIPTQDGIRFLTSYDYFVRYGALGRAFDTLIFRRLLGWATAWSFDRLRLWTENGIDPALSMQRALLHTLATVAVAFVWIYQGIAPKLLTVHPDELAMLHNAGFSSTSAPVALQVLGWSEVAAGLAMLIFCRSRWPFVLTIAAMILATIVAAASSPQFLGAAFNPISLNLLMIAISSVGLMTIRDLPSARRCLRTNLEKTR